MIRSKLASLLQAAWFAGAVMLASPPARADVCAADQRPAASLLIPHFVVDLSGTAGQDRNTRFWVRNMATRSRLTNVTLWTTWGVPGFSFNVYLPAYGTQRIDLAALFLQGVLPQTGSAITPVGAFDSVGTPQVYASCNTGTAPGQPPIYTPLSAGAQTELRNRFRGAPAQGGQCFGHNLNDNVARGYVTIDQVYHCVANTTPDDPGYFVGGGAGLASNENILLGGVEYLHPASNLAHASPAYALEAADNLFVPGDVTFYGRLVAYGGSDGREPLPMAWAFEFDSENSADADDADLQIFRATPSTSPRSCASVPPWFPLEESERVPFDRAGNTPTPDPFPLGESQSPIGLATQAFPAEEIDVLLLDPLPRAGSGRINFSDPNGFVTAAYPDGQAMLSVHHRWQGRFSEMQQGRALDSGCPGGLQIPARVGGPVMENPTTLSYIFADNFSS
jgi:hypothetical protein